jgi:cellulose synthase/poly-beta-1,6-N-acetylglucosamine synthase-like glycosyltransferase
MNVALPYTRAEIVITVDCDSSLDDAALWECVQYLKDPEVGAVSATVFSRNPYVNHSTWMQAYECLHAIFTGRMVAERFGMLDITSGAFACLRREAVERTLGWDVGPGEDLDLTMRIRHLGYKVRCAPYADCLTDVPTIWKQLWRQRLRWEEASVVRTHCRKHIDIANPSKASFRWANFFVSFELITVNLVFGYVVLIYSAWLCVKQAAPRVVRRVHVLRLHAAARIHQRADLDLLQSHETRASGDVSGPATIDVLPTLPHRKPHRVLHSRDLLANVIQG